MTIRRRRNDRDDSENSSAAIVRPAAGQRFRQLLERHIAPQVEQGITINPERRGYGDILWRPVRLDSAVVILLHIYYSASPSPAGITLPC